MLESYRGEFVDFCTAWMREHYLYLSGQKTALEIAPIYDRFGDLFTQESITSLKTALDETPKHFETERVAIGRLLLFASEQFLESSARELTERVSEYEGRPTIDVGGRAMTFQEAAIAIRTDPDRQSRRAIHKASTVAVEASNDLTVARLGLLHAAARKLDHRSYTALFEDLRGLSYTDLGTDAEVVLAQTENTYVARLDEALRTSMGLRLEQAERSDALYFLRLTNYDSRFPGGGLLRVYGRTLAGLGIDIDRQTNVLLDGEARPRKSARAFCMPISVPDEIKLVISRIGGQSDYQALLHEAGHAQHYAWTARSLSPEFKYVGDYALSESYAFLFNHLISNKVWLSSMVGFNDSREFVRLTVLTRLLQMRRYIARLKYEVELHSNDDPGCAADRYAELQTGATRFETAPTEFLFDLDDAFYSANYVRAWAFEVLLREYLMTRFGNSWWTSPQAGNLLKEMWETGDRYTADEMATQIGIGPITFEPLIEDLNQSLN